MANDSVGSVSLDLLLNSKEFETKLNSAVNKATTNINGKMNKSLNNTGALFSKLGKLAAGAFAVSSIVKFGKACVDLGSDLAEVRTLAGTVFGDMYSDLDKWASKSIETMGLSETSAKKYASTIASIFKSAGGSGQEIYDVSTNLTQLASDMSSFYNLDHSEAFEKIKAGLVGSSEPLLSLGIDLREGAVEAYALANGLTTNYKALSNLEKMQIRYQALLSQTADAQGDFVRNQNSWSVQTKILSEQWAKFKANLGQGFINVLLPIIRVINTLMAKLQVLGEMFSNFTAKLFGKAETTTSNVVSGLDESLSGVVDNANSAADAIDGVADATKEANKTTFGFDELNTLSADASATGGAGAGIGAGVGAGLTESITKTEELTEETSVYEKVLDKLISKAKQLANLFKIGFKIGLDSSGFAGAVEGIKTSVDSIKNSFMSIFSDGQVLGAFNRMIGSFTYSLGTLTGNIIGVGTSLANGLIGSISAYLDSNKEFIKQKLISMFNIYSEITMTYTQIFNDVGEIVSNFFNSELFATFGGNILSILINPFLIAQELLMNIFNDLLSGISLIISENKDKIQTTLDGLLSFINGILQNISDLIDFIGEKVTSVYNSYIKPAIDNISEGFSNLVGTILDLWNEYVQPVLDHWGEKITELFDSHIKPFVDKFLTGIGKIIKIVSEVWKEVLEPLISWILSIITPVLMPLIQGLGDFVIGLVGKIFDVIGWLWDKLVWLIENIGKFVIKVKDILTGLFNGVKTIFNNIKNAVSGAVNTLKTSVMTGFNAIRDGASNIFNGLKDKVSSIFGSLVDIVKTPINAIISLVNSAIDSINGLSIDAPDWVEELTGISSFGFSIPKIPMLKDGGLVSQPTLSMIGEGKEPEIVSPLSMLRQIENEGSSETNALLKELINLTTQLLNKDQNIYMDGYQFATVTTNIQNSEKRRRG